VSYDTIPCTCTCRWWTTKASALEQAHILVVVIQPLLEGVDRWCLYNVLRQGIPIVNDSLWELKKNFLASSLQCLLYNFRLWPLVCRLESANWKKVSLSTFSFPDKILKVSIRSPLILRLFNVVSPKIYSRSGYFLPFIAFTHFLALFWTFSSTSSSLRKCGFDLALDTVF